MGGRSLLVATAVGLLAMPPLAWSAPRGPERVAYGEDALSYASGIIHESLPIDGLVSQISGDNETSGNRRLLAKGDILYLTLKQAREISPGAHYTVYRHVHRVTHPRDGQHLGNLFIMVAIVKVIDVSQAPATVELVRSYSTVFPGDRIMRFVAPPRPEGKSDARQPEGEGMIVDFPPSRTLIGQGDVVFIDWGRDRDVLSGDRLEVFRDSVGLPRRVIGELKVLTVGDRTSSALITRSTYPYRLGDRFVFKEEAPELPEMAVAEDEALEVEQEELQQVASVPVPGKDVSLGEEEGQEQQQQQQQQRELLQGPLGQIEFDSGSVVIRLDAVETLKEMSELLRGATGQPIRVEGHTDNVEIGPTLKQTYPTNWELSKARATEVVRYLVEEAGIDPANLSAVGHADTQPVASNAAEEGRRENRRVEILVYSANPADTVPDELLDSDQEPVMEDTSFTIEEGEVIPAPIPEEALPPTVDEAKAFPGESSESERDPMTEDIPFFIEEREVTPAPVPEEEPLSRTGEEGDPFPPALDLPSEPRP